MKTVLGALILLTATSSFAETWLCSAQCGTVDQVLNIAREAIVPVYRGRSAMGEGPTVGSAFQALRADCNLILHDGFDVYNAYYIDLNTVVRPEHVCRRM